MLLISDYIKKANPELQEQKNANIPVFLHIPKCAGTFTLQLLIQLLFVYSYLKFRVFQPEKYWVVYQVYDGDLLFLRVLTLDTKKENRGVKNFQDIKFDDFLNLYRSGDIHIFCMVVTSQAFLVKNNPFLSAIGAVRNKSFIFFTNLRSVFSRCLSLYHVHKKNKKPLASLYLPHDEYSIDEFSKFLKSHDSSPGWISYFFSTVFNMSPSEVSMFVKNYVGATHITGVIPQLEYVFSSVYGEGLTNFLKSLPEVHMNDGNYSNSFTPDSLSSEDMEAFKRLHSNDITLVKAMLPELTYDSSGVCEIKGYKADSQYL